MTLDKFSNVIFKTSTISAGNMSFTKGIASEALSNRRKWLESLGISMEEVVGMSLVHKTDIKLVTKNDKGKGIFDSESAIECDGFITNEPNVFLFMITGDCLPIAFYDPQTKTIALIHASRHNLITGIIKSTIEKLTDQGASPENLIVQIGPSIGPCCYHSPRTQVKRYTNPELQPYIFETETDYGCDLWLMAEDLLQKAGIPKPNVDNLRICTYHSGKYFSYRKVRAEKLEHDYRIATVLGFKND